MALENINVKEEDTDNQHFFHFPPYFLPTQEQIPPYEKHLNCLLLTLCHIIQTFNDPEKKTF